MQFQKKRKILLIKIWLLIVSYVIGADFSSYDCNKCLLSKGKMCLNDKNYSQGSCCDLSDTKTCSTF